MYKKIITVVWILFTFLKFQAQELSMRNQILVDVKINNKVNKFIFDTGAPTLVFDKTIEIDEENKIVAYDADKHIDTFYFPKEKVKLKLDQFDISSKSKNSLILSKNKPAIFEKENIQGIFGNNFIYNYDWFYDGKLNKISLLNNKKEINRTEYYEIPLVDKNFIECSFLTDKEVLIHEYFELDTGYIGFLKSKKANEFNQYLTGISKNSSVVKVVIDTVKIIKSDFSLGKIKLKNAPIVINNSEESINLIGVEFLKCFESVYFLFSENKLLLKKKDSIEHDFYNPTYFLNTIYGYLQNNDNCFYKDTVLKEWEIDKEINPAVIEFEKISFPMKILENHKN